MLTFDIIRGCLSADTDGRGTHRVINAMYLKEVFARKQTRIPLRLKFVITQLKFWVVYKPVYVPMALFSGVEDY